MEVKMPEPVLQQTADVRTFDWQFPPPVQASPGQLAMAEFRQRAQKATESGFLAAFPNFYYATYGLNHVGGTIFIRPEAGLWRDVPLWELNNVSLDNFEDRMRAANVYASRNGFVGGFPTYFHANYGNGIVCGTILLKPGYAEWRDVFLSDLGNPPLEDFAARFRATQDYANRNGFVGGFPNLFHAPATRWLPVGHVRVPVPDVVCGTVLLRPGAAEWRDVTLFRDPA
jgi:hypothetical protein